MDIECTGVEVEGAKTRGQTEIERWLLFGDFVFGVTTMGISLVYSEIAPTFTSVAAAMLIDNVAGSVLAEQFEDSYDDLSVDLNPNDPEENKLYGLYQFGIDDNVDRIITSFSINLKFKYVSDEKKKYKMLKNKGIFERPECERRW